jgi:hypothetical protein
MVSSEGACAAYYNYGGVQLAQLLRERAERGETPARAAG